VKAAALCNDVLQRQKELVSRVFDEQEGIVQYEPSMRLREQVKGEE